MKILTIFCVVISLHGSFYSYTQSSKKIIGTWKVDVTESIELMNADQRAKYDAFDKATKEQVADELKNQTYSFQSDNTFSIRTLQGTSSGKWDIDAKNLVLSFSSGKVTSNFIEKSTKKLLMLRIIDDPSSEALFHRIALYSLSNN
ncbi:DUF5004 domain-containing protein [Ekhidna sp.]|uniref:DUF5004 domain-containing protein n=1 Tax=Ekhidna sp. TaxID=2608089 RepID=UPI003CCBFEF3